MKKLLITGFEPFGKKDINSSWEAVKNLPDVINGYELTKLLLPVTFQDAARTVLNLADRLKPDVILSIGQAGGRDAITPEIVGINLRYATIPDNNGYEPKDIPIIEEGKTAYFSNLPVRKMAEAINASGTIARVSYSAGTFVCNDLFYSLLARFSQSNTRVGFIHIPYCKEQNETPCIEISDAVKGIVAAINSIEGDGTAYDDMKNKKD